MTLTKQKTVRRTPPNHRKRTGQHHQQTKHYAKAYWPYLPVFAVLSLGMFVNSFVARMHHSVLGYATNVSGQVLLAETNGERLSNHKPALQINQQLVKAAQAKANDMATRNYWSHVTPDGKQPWSFMASADYQYQAAGENLAYGFGTSEQVITAWMHSPEHRANILNANYQDVGFATANVMNYQGTGPETITVAMYGEPIGAIPTNTKTDQPEVLSTSAQTVSRLQLASTTPLVEIILAAMSGAAITLFFVRHAFAWHKVLVRGEEFALHHPFFDVFLMSAAVLAFLFSHAAGAIL
jgi:uncharacterized protein YkwD